MTRAEFTRLEDIINTNLGKASFLANRDIEDTFWNFCVTYGYETCRKAIIDLIENEEYNPEGRRVPLSLYIVERKIERESRLQRERENRKEDANARICPNCGNRGYILMPAQNGADYMKPCSCSVGREKYPWAGKSLTELQDEGDEGTRRSWASYERYRAPEEYHRTVKYGE